MTTDKRGHEHEHQVEDEDMATEPVPATAPAAGDPPPEPARQAVPAKRRPTKQTYPVRLLKRSARRTEKIPTAGGSTLHLLVLSSTREDTTVVVPPITTPACWFPVPAPPVPVTLMV